MVSVKAFIGAAAAAMICVSNMAFAADMPQMLPPPPQPQVAYQPPLMVMAQPESAWYLRGDVGIGITSQVNFVFQNNPANTPPDILTQNAVLGDTFFFNVGAGYEFISWLRFDFTAEYRAKTELNAFIMYNCGGGCVLGDQYHAFLKTELFLANAYVDLGTWNCITPFVGFGIGGAFNTFDDLTDLGVGTSGNGVGTNASQLNFAWALHAGLAYNVTKNFTMELAYRYLNFGSVSDQIFCMGGCNPDTYKLTSLTSQDFMFGMRWRFPIEAPPITYVQQAPLMLQPAPAVAQPAPVYQPAPMYQPPVYQPPVYQPPLSTRG